MTEVLSRMSPGRRRILIAGGVLLLAAVVGFGARWWLVGRHIAVTDNAYVRADTVVVAPHVAGYVTAVLVADNQAVRSGQLLARIDDRDYRAKLEAAEGAVATAEGEVLAQQARLATVAAEDHRMDSLVAEATAAVTAGVADAQRARLDHVRQQWLASQQVTSAGALEAAEAGARRTAADLVARRAALAAERGRRPLIAAERDAATAGLLKARGALKQARANLALAGLDLAYGAIRAPQAGRIGQRRLRVGQYVEVGSPLMAIVPDTAYVVANYKETDVRDIRTGQPVEIAVDALGISLAGHVDSFAPASGAEFALLPPDNATGNFTKIVQRMPVRIRIDPGQPRAADLRPGMSVVTRIDTRHDR